jgi:hypothetical protein
MPHARSMGRAVENLPKFLSTRETRVQYIGPPEKQTDESLPRGTNLARPAQICCKAVVGIVQQSVADRGP